MDVFAQTPPRKGCESMNQLIRRTLSLFLALTMVAGMLPMGVFASEGTDPTEEVIAATEAVTEVTTPEPTMPSSVPTETVTEPAETVPATTATETTPATVAQETLPDDPPKSLPSSPWWRNRMGEMSEEDFATAVAAAAAKGDTYDLSQNVTLTAATAELTIQNFVHVQHGYTLTLAEGAVVRVKNQGQLVAEGGTIHVQNGASLIVESDSFVQVWTNGTLNVDSGGTLSALPGLIVVNVDHNVTVTGVPESMFTATYNPKNGAEMEHAYNTYGAPYARVAVYLWDNVTLDRSITIPNNCSLYIQANSGHSLTVPEGCTLTNNGNIFLEANSDNRIVVEKDATFTNRGWVTINTPATFSVLGTYNNYGTVGGNGSITTTPPAYITAQSLRWSSQDNGWVVDTSAEPSRDMASNFTAWHDHFLLFYLNTYNAAAQRWEQSPVIPDGFDSAYISLEPLSAIDQQPADGQANSEYFVRLRTQGTLNYQKTTMACGDSHWDVEIWQKSAGLYSGPVASPDNALYSTFYFDSTQEETALYLLTLSSRYTLQNVTIDATAWDSSYEGATITYVATDGGYKITVSPEFTAHCQESWDKLQLHVSCSTYDSQLESTSQWQLNLDILPAPTSPDTPDTPAPYVTARWLDWCEEGLFENTDVELSQDTASSITAGDKNTYIFYLNTWDTATNGYTAQPIVPTSGSEYITITRLVDTDQQIKTDEVNKDYFVSVEAHSTLTAVRASLSFGDLTWDYQIHDRWAGFFSAKAPTADTILNEGNFYLDAAREENSFYWTALNGCTFDSFSYEVNTWGQDYSDATGGQDLVTLTQLSDTVYQFTISQNFAEYVQYDWRNFNITIHAVVRNSEDFTQQFNMDIWVNPGQMKEQAARLEIWTEPDQSCVYNFYKDSDLVFWDHRTGYDEDGNEIWVREQTALPTGVSYDSQTNTLVLDNANLYGINLFTTDEDPRLPEDRLNIQLLGSSTMEHLRISDNAQVTITEASTGTLTCSSLVEVYDAAHLTFPDYKILLSGSCEIRADDSAISGEFSYADGASYMTMYWLDYDEEGKLFFNEENGGGRVSQNGILATESSCYLFFLNTWSSDEKTWKTQPIVPTTDSEYLTIQTVRSLGEAIQNGQEYAEYFVRMTASGTLDGQPASLSYGDLTEPFWIGRLEVGFFSKPDRTPENLLPDQHFYDTTLDGDNTFYMILPEDITVDSMDISFDTWGEDYSFITGDEALVTVQAEEGYTNVYRCTVNPKFVDYTKYIWKNFNFVPTLSYRYSDGGTADMTWGIYINPPAKDTVQLKALFNVNKVTYCFYEDGTIFCASSDDNFIYHKITAQDLPLGVSYDLDSNVLTLNGANLEALAFHWEDEWTDEDGVLHRDHLLPTKTVTLNLIGANTIKSTDCTALALNFGANMTITGSGSLDIHTVNTFAQTEDGGRACYPAVMLSGDSTLTIADSATVTVVNDYTTATLQEWMWGISSDGGNSGLVLKDSATLNVRMPEERVFKCDFPTEGCGYLPIHTGNEPDCGLKTITIQGNATLNTDAMELNGCTYTQTGGTWNISTNPTCWENQTHDGLFTCGATMNISGGELNIIARYNDDAAYQDYMFYGIQLTGGSVMNVSGGEINICNQFRKGFGIAIYSDDQGQGGSLAVTGGTLNLLNEKQDIMFFNALSVETNLDQCQFHMSGGTINANGRMFPTTFYMEDGTINLTGCDDSELPSCLEVFTGYIHGGKIAINNATFVNDGNFSVDGGEIAITNTIDGMTGLENNGYLPINGGTLTVETLNATAIVNYATLHQMGGSITATANGGKMPGIISLGALLLNSGTMEVSGRIGIVQSYDSGNEYGPSREECYFQTGGGTGDHQLTIRASAVGILADGVVQLTGNSQVTINVANTEADGDACGICAEKFIERPDQTGENLTSIIIEGAAQVQITVTDINGEGMGLFAARSPLTIRSTELDDGTVIAPTLSIQADMVIRDVYETAPGLTFTGVVPYSTNGTDLTGSWYEDTTEEGHSRKTLYDGSSPATNVTIKRPKPVIMQAEFAIMPYRYRIYMEDGQQVVEARRDGTDAYLPGTLPDGVAYDLTTNTLTLANEEPLNFLDVTYLTADPYTGDRISHLPSQDFTIHLAGEHVEIYMFQLGGKINATITGSGTLRLMDGSGINGTLTLADGVTLVNDYSFSVYAKKDSSSVLYGPGQLIVSPGATLVNNHTLLVNAFDDVYSCLLDIQGTFIQGEDGITLVDWTQRENVIGNISKNMLTINLDITTEEALADILEDTTLSQYKQTRIGTQDLELTESYTLPTHVVLVPAGGTLTIGETGSLTVAGTVNLCDELYGPGQLCNNGTLRIAKGGCLYMDGNFQGNAPINEGGKILPLATELTIEKPEKTTFDLYQDASVDLKITITSQDTEKMPLQRVTWKSSNEKIVDPADIQDNQDGTYTVKFTGKAIGKVTLTATTIDGAKKTAKVTLTTTCLPSAKLTATLTDTAVSDGLQMGESIQMTVFADEIQLAPQLVRFTSSNESIATVDENGVIVGGTKTGTVKITAKLNIDGDSRSVSQTVKVIKNQIVRIDLYDDYAEEDGASSFGTPYLDAYGNTSWELSELDGQSLTIPIYPGVVTWSTELDLENLEEYDPEAISASKLKWASSDTSLATVKIHKDGYALVTVKAKAHGVFTITATSTDTNKAVGSATFSIMDYTPRLGNSSVTLNPKKGEHVDLNLVGAYGDTIEAVEILEENYGELLTVEQNDDTDAWEVYANSSELKNQTIKLTLLVTTDRTDEPYSLKLTVSVKGSIPKVSVSQEEKLNLTYLEEYAQVIFTAKDSEVYRVELAEDSSSDIDLLACYLYQITDEDGETYPEFDYEFDEEQNYDSCSFYLHVNENCGSKINTKVKFLVYLRGYIDPVAVSYTPKTTASKVKLTTNPTSSVINTTLADSYRVTFQVLDADGWNVLNAASEEDIQVYSGSTELTDWELVTNEDTWETSLCVSFDEAFAGTLTVKLRSWQWSQAQTATHKVTKTSKAPTLTLEDSTLTLYRTFCDIPVYTAASLSQGNVSLSHLDNFQCSNAEAMDGIALRYDEETDRLIASFADPENPVTAGTYTFTADIYYYDVFGDSVPLSKKASFKIKVAQEPTIKMEGSTIKLNKNLAADVGGSEENWVSSQHLGHPYDTLIFGGEELWVVGLVSEDGSIRIRNDGEEYNQFHYDSANGIRLGMDLWMNGFNVTASLLTQNAKKTTYTLYPVVSRTVDNGPHSDNSHVYYTMRTPITFTVQPYSGKVSVSLSASGKLDTLLPESAITYTATVKNAFHDSSADDLSNVGLAAWDISDIQLLDETGKPTDMFLIEHGYTVVKEQCRDTITLRLNPDYEPGYAGGKTYKIQFRYTVCSHVFNSGTISVKVNQSTPKVTASTVNYFHAEQAVSKTVTLNLTSPAGAAIGRVELNEKKTSKELLTALAAQKDAYLDDFYDDFDYEKEYFSPVACFREEDVRLSLTDPTTAKVRLHFGAPGALKAGKSYSLYLDVYPEALANTEKPVTVKVTVKVAK